MKHVFELRRLNYYANSYYERMLYNEWYNAEQQWEDYIIGPNLEMNETGFFAFGTSNRIKGELEQ